MGRKIDGQMLQYHRRTMRVVRQMNRNTPGEGWKILAMAHRMVLLENQLGIGKILKHHRQRLEELA